MGKRIAAQPRNCKSRRPAFFVLLYAAGEPKEKILAELNVGESSLRRWYTRWVDDSIDGLLHLGDSSIERVIEHVAQQDPGLAARIRFAVARVRDLVPDDVYDFKFKEDAMEKTMNNATTELWEVPVQLIKPNPRQPRSEFDEVALRELAGTIKEHGLIQPLIVTKNDHDDHYTLLAGERRWRAAQLIGLEVVQCIVKTHVDDRMMTEIALIENVQREDLSAADEVRAYHQLIELGLTVEEIAQRVGKARATIQNLLGLLRLPAPALNLVGGNEGQLPQRYARALAPVAHLIPEKDLVEAAKAIAAPRDDGQWHNEPEAVIAKLIDSVTQALPRKENSCWDLAWPGKPVTVADPEGDISVRDCKGCEHFIAAGRRCANVRCFKAKTQLYARREIERVAKKAGIPIAAADEAVTMIDIDWQNDGRIKRWMAGPAKHLRLLPVTPEHRSDYHTQQVLGSAFVLLATTDPAVLKAKEKEAQIIPEDESEAAKAKRLAAEERERDARRKEKGEARRARADVTWLVTHTAEALAPKMSIAGGVLHFTAGFVRGHSELGLSEWDEMSVAFNAHQKAVREAQDRAAQLEPRLREQILLCRILDALHAYTPREQFNWPRALKKVEEVAKAFDLKLPKGWNEPPVHRTESNCWHCGQFTSLDHLTQRDMEEGWSAVYQGQKPLDVKCPACNKSKKKSAKK